MAISILGRRCFSTARICRYLWYQLGVTTILGASTILFALIAFIWLPRSPATWWYLSPREKEIARIRILSDSSVAVDEKLSLRDSFRALENPMYWYNSPILPLVIRALCLIVVQGLGGSKFDAWCPFSECQQFFATNCCQPRIFNR